jgi:hypothetical protein
MRFRLKVGSNYHSILHFLKISENPRTLKCLPSRQILCTYSQAKEIIFIFVNRFTYVHCKMTYIPVYILANKKYLTFICERCNIRYDLTCPLDGGWGGGGWRCRGGCQHSCQLSSARPPPSSTVITMQQQQFYTFHIAVDF